MEESPLYQIVDWNENFENSKSRQRSRCGFVCFPNRHGGLGLCAVLSEPDGGTIYGVWALMIQLCSRHATREGWLTHNGKQDGPRMTAAEIATAFRRTKIEVYRMLQVTSRADVGWLKLVEGKPEYSQNCEAEVTADGQSVTADGQSVTADGQSVTADGQSVTAEQEPDNKNDNSVTADGQSVTADGQSVTADGQRVTQERKKEGKKPENETVPTTTPLLSLSQNCEDEGIQYAEAKLWLNELFRNPMPWTYEEDHLLSEALPIPRDLQRLIDWAYRLPKDSPLHEMTKLKQKRVTLLRELGGEGDKLRMIRKQMGYNGDPGVKK